MKKNNKGFTLIELLAVIVILSIILVIATTSVIKSINDSKEKAKYTAAKEIVQISEAYFATSGGDSASINDLKAYLEEDATNPKTGENDLMDTGLNQVICRDSGYSSENQNGYSNNDNSGYEFDGYWYGFDGTCK